uniref:Cystatin kininogen-type domain-containing protein n=1 Tax=Mola mola TaxID=94237 RepID=A0A3Q3VTF8_MOLML
MLCFHYILQEPEAVSPKPDVPMFCDDPSVEKAVYSAVSKYNKKLNVGNKLALFQILNAILSIPVTSFSTRRSDCPAGSPKPWTECNYLPRQKVPIVCNAMVQMTVTEEDKIKVHCVLEKFICLGCAVDVDLTSVELKGPLSVSISKYNSESPSTHLFTFHSVSHATRQVVAGFRYKLRFDMKKTICAKVEHKDLTKMCVADEQDEFVNCNSTVIVAPWRLEPPQTQAVCESGPPKGFCWSPLRNILFEEAPSTTTASPITPAAKEESSEEDIKTLKMFSPTIDVNNTHLHCPSEPWKPFSPPGAMAPVASTKATIEATSPQPAAGQAFSDKDLLA